MALTVHEPGLGAIRLQWWRDAFRRMATARAMFANRQSGGRRLADVAAALRLASRPSLVERPLAGYEREIDADGIPDERPFEAYLGETWGTAFRLGTVVARRT